MVIDRLSAAIRLADFGYRVFPCKPGGKTPLTAHGCLDATTDEDQINEWWIENPQANIGVSTDGLLIVDVDPLSDGSANDFASDIDRLAELLVSAGATTPRKGSHFWFRQPVGADLRNTAGKIAPGVDTRANGGYVLVPPSDVEGVGAYHWMFGFELDVSLEKLSEPPAWVLELLGAQTPSEAAPTSDSSEIPEGQRNQWLTSRAGYMRNGGFSQEEIEAALLRSNIERCQPPLSADEVRKIAWSIARYIPDQIATAVAEGWAEADQATATAKAATDPGKLPNDLLMPGGFLQDVMAWNAQTAFKSQPELALAAALALLSVLTGRKICDQRGTRTNIYCLGICDTGGGKEHARKCNKAILQAAGLEKLIGPEGIGSHTGIVSTLKDSPASLFQVDEFGKFMATTNSPGKSPHLWNVVGVLLKLYTSADSMYIGDAVSDQRKIARIDQPHAVLYGTTTPGPFFDSLAKESLSDGFVSRLLIFEASENDPDSRDAMKDDAPRDIVAQAAWWGSYQPGGNLAGVNAQPRIIAMSAEAKTVFRELEIVSRANAKLDRPTAKIWTRATEKAAKLALLHQVSLDREATEVSRASAEWACWVSHHLTERTEYICGDWVSENQWEAACHRVLRMIRAAESAGLSLSEITAKTFFLRPKDRGDVLTQLEQSGRITSFKRQTKGRPRMVYIATEHLPTVG